MCIQPQQVVANCKSTVWRYSKDGSTSHEPCHSKPLSSRKCHCTQESCSTIADLLTLFNVEDFEQAYDWLSNQTRAGLNVKHCSQSTMKTQTSFLAKNGIDKWLLKKGWLMNLGDSQNCVGTTLLKQVLRNSQLVMSESVHTCGWC